MSNERCCAHGAGWAFMSVCQSVYFCPFSSSLIWFSACFVKYVKTKITKRLETNKVRGAFNDPPRALLLPLSFGSSSVALLHILDEQISAQLNRSGHASYSIHIVHINESFVDENPEYSKLASLVRERFHSHKFSFLSLEDAFDYLPDEEGIFCDELPLALGQKSIENRAHLNQLISSLPSATSRIDISNILRSRLLVGFAKENNCHVIVYGDSATRLAEKTLSETAKGRGNSLPWLIADVSSSHDIKVMYPMRDLLRTEIIDYTAMVSEPLTTLLSLPKSLVTAPVSSKTTTIDDLMSQYFSSVEQSYPSIVTNVVRTASKLKFPATTSASPSCNVCGFPFVRDSEPWGGDQHKSTDKSETAMLHMRTTCYGCARSIEKP